MCEGKSSTGWSLTDQTENGALDRESPDPAVFTAFKKFCFETTWRINSLISSGRSTGDERAFVVDIDRIREKPQTNLFLSPRTPMRSTSTSQG